MKTVLFVTSQTILFVVHVL